MKINYKLIIGIIAVCIIGVTIVVGLRACDNKKNKITENHVTQSAPTYVNRVHNLIILDESWSMSGLEAVSVSGVNETINTIKEAYRNNSEQEQLLTMVTFSFDNGLRIVHHYDYENIKDIQYMEANRFQPSGMTPLWDAIGCMCAKIEEEGRSEDIVLVTIITDGLENASTRYDRTRIRQLINRLDKKGWVFTYIGANQDAASIADSMGIRNAMEYDSDEIGTKAMWEKENNSRKLFYERTQTTKSKSELKDKYFE